MPIKQVSKRTKVVKSSTKLSPVRKYRGRTYLDFTGSQKFNKVARSSSLIVYKEKPKTGDYSPILIGKKTLYANSKTLKKKYQIHKKIITKESLEQIKQTQKKTYRRLSRGKQKVAAKKVAKKKTVPTKKYKLSSKQLTHAKEHIEAHYLDYTGEKLPNTKVTITKEFIHTLSDHYLSMLVKGKRVGSFTYGGETFIIRIKAGKILAAEAKVYLKSGDIAQGGFGEVRFLTNISKILRTAVDQTTRDQKSIQSSKGGKAWKVPKEGTPLPGSGESSAKMQLEYELKFNREIRAFVKKHQNSPGLIAGHQYVLTGTEFNHKGSRGILMKRFDGDLKELIQSGDLTLKQKISISRQIAEGLAFLGRVGLMHFDLKPENIMFIRKGEEIEIAIADFGIANTQKNAQEKWNSSKEDPVRGGNTAHYGMISSPMICTALATDTIDSSLYTILGTQADLRAGSRVLSAILVGDENFAAHTKPLSTNIRSDLSKEMGSEKANKLCDLLDTLNHHIGSINMFTDINSLSKEEFMEKHADELKHNASELNNLLNN